MEEATTTPGAESPDLTTAALLNRPKTKKKAAEEAAAAAEIKAAEARELDDDEYVCFVRPNWGTAQIPPGKVDYVDKYSFVGGVGRNILYKHARLWVKRGVARGFILPNDATLEDIQQVTGRKPEDPKSLIEMLQSMTPEKVIAHFGVEYAETMARDLLERARRVKEDRV